MEKAAEILLRRKQQLIVSKSNESILQTQYIVTILKNIENIGYTLSKEIIDILSTFSVKELDDFYSSLVRLLKEMIGSNKTYAPMYPNFPEQVMNEDESLLYFNALIHYLSSGHLFPKYEKEDRSPLIDLTDLKVIKLGSKTAIDNIIRNLLASKTSLSEIDKRDITWFIENYPEKLTEIVPDEIPLKENIALLAKLLIDNNLPKGTLFKLFNTATDVLRLAVALSDGDISLAQATKFKSFRRKERRLLLSLLNNCDNIEEDMVKYKNRWIRLGERLHPSEYKEAYGKAQIAFRKLRNNEKIETFNSKVSQAIKTEDYATALELLKQRPGEFARKLDHLIRIHSKPNVVVNTFKDVAQSVSSTVLLQVITHFKNRNMQHELRTFFPKGNVAKVFGIDNTLPEIDERICKNIIDICETALINIYKEKDYLGKVYIDESLKNYVVPFSQRSASKALHSIVRGSKINLQEVTNTLRTFVYWKQPKAVRVDVDLSAVMYDEDWNYLEHISYTNLRSKKYNAAHSGDITAAPDGASEFIDIDIESVKKYGGRYIIISINNYTELPFTEMQECFMGWMNRQHPNSGEIYEPKTVENKIDITSETMICIPMILDLHEMKYIWTDISLKAHPSYHNNVEKNNRGMVLMGKAFANLEKPKLYDLFHLHMLARGQRCDNIEEADVIFSLEQGITPYDQDIIVSQYI
ncbi:TerD family protein [Bacillus solimangrovi]|uniref:Cytoplasmic protein n=1 Tax=Bacillus solimangrovi TaxID=1305675 RepID=A0A1E5LHS2_9BACI|nr:TerD family protein [Bacillus solimangrovi]OEH93617.1 cytoplasmic protein [Bacillus solimangrovi]